MVSLCGWNPPTDRPSFPKRHADIGGREDSSGKYRPLQPKSSPFLSPLSWTCKTRAPPEPRPSPEMRHPPLAQIRQPSMANRHIHVSAGSRALLVSRLGDSSHIIKHATTTTSRGGGCGGGDTMTPLTSVKHEHFANTSSPRHFSTRAVLVLSRTH